MENKNYDVIIIGAGPAGLSVGSELSKKHKVLVVEKNDVIGQTTKSWFIPKFFCDGNDEVKQFMYGGVKSYITDTFSGAKVVWPANLDKGYWYVKEHEILKYWAEIIKKNKSDIISSCYYEDHVVKDGVVTVETSQGKFQGKLLIDASGHDSLILKKYETEQDYYWWSIYGCIAEHPNGLQDMKVGDYMFWGTYSDTNIDPKTSLRKGRVVFEYEILTENTSFPLILYLRKEKVQQDFMEKEFMHILREEKATKNFHDVKIKELKYGWYPSGGLSQKISQDNVAFIGDAGCWTTPCGWGMGFTLTNYKKYVKTIDGLLKNNTLDKARLDDAVDFKTHERQQILMNALATHFLSNANAEQLDRFIKFFDEGRSIMCEKMFTLSITHEDVRNTLKEFLKHFELKELIKILPMEDYLLLLEEVKYFVEDSIIDEVKGLLNIFKPGNGKKGPESGIDF